jgi:hypothetical protein
MPRSHLQNAFVFILLSYRSDTNHEMPMPSVRATSLSDDASVASEICHVNNVGYVMRESESVWLYRFGCADTIYGRTVSAETV